MIEWNKVTWYSNLLAVVIFLLVFGVGFYFGREYQRTSLPDSQPITVPEQKPPKGEVGFGREGDSWVYYDRDGNKPGLILPVQKEPYMSENQEQKYRTIPLRYEVSPDSTKVAYFAKESDLELGQENIYVVNIDGSGKELIVAPQGKYAHGVIEWFYWGLDGETITYKDSTSDIGQSAFTLYKVDILSKQKKKLDSEMRFTQP